MKKAKVGRRRSLEQAPHPLAELAERTSCTTRICILMIVLAKYLTPALRKVTTTDLEVLAIHHQMLSQFCVPTADDRWIHWHNSS
jgi:hypothetical protein